MTRLFVEDDWRSGRGGEAAASSEDEASRGRSGGAANDDSGRTRAGRLRQDPSGRRSLTGLEFRRRRSS